MRKKRVISCDLTLCKINRAMNQGAEEQAPSWRKSSCHEDHRPDRIVAALREIRALSPAISTPRGCQSAWLFDQTLCHDLIEQVSEAKQRDWQGGV
jgi:hypothetical protein